MHRIRAKLRTSTIAVKPPAPPSSSALPMELLFEIFLLVVSASDAFEPQVEQSIAVTLMTLSHVSRTWRQTAILSPLLWSYMHIHTGTPDRHFIPKLEMCLERSQGCLLDITIVTGDSGLADLSAFTTYAFDRLAFHSKRWAAITIEFDSNPFFHRRCLESLGRPLKLPHLHTVRLSDVSYLPQCFKNAPAMRSLDVRLSWNHVAVIFLPLAPETCQSVTTLSIVGVPVALMDATSFLQSHPLITSLTLETGTAEHEQRLPWPNTPTSLPNLASLELKQACYILRVFHCPKLRTLCLSTQQITGNSTQIHGLKDELPTFLARTPSLRTLRIQPTGHLDWLQEPLTSGSLIEHLDLGFSGQKDRQVLAGLMFTPSTAFLLCLTSISLSFHPPNWRMFYFSQVEEFLKLLPRRNSESTVRSAAFPALERVNLLIDLLYRPLPWRGEKMEWYKQWLEIKDTVLPGAMNLKVTYPKEGRQKGDEVIDLEKWLKPEKPKVIGRKNRGQRMSLGSIFR